MFKMIKWLFVVVLLGGLALMGCSVLSTPKSFDVSQSRLQKMVDKNWTTVAAKLNESHVTMASPTLRMMPESQRLGADFDAFIETGILGVKIDGRMSVSGVPAYDEAQGAVVLRDMTVDHFDVQNMPQMFGGLIKSQAQRVVGQKFGADVPIYKIEPEKLHFAGKTWLPEKVLIASDHITVTLQPK